MDMLQFQDQPGQSQTGSTKTTSCGQGDGARRATAVCTQEVTRCSAFGIAAPDPEVTEKTKRRKFTAAYKLRILQEADQCEKSGQIGALLRREGLYSSNLTTWRRQRDEGLLLSLSAKKRGRKPKAQDPSAARITQLEKENQQLKNQLRKAEIIIEAQKKISEILGIDQNQQENGGSR